jgi:hypothetical protein
MIYTQKTLSKTLSQMGLWWLASKSKLPTQQSQDRIRQPPQSPEPGPRQKTVYQKQTSGWEAALLEKRRNFFFKFHVVFLTWQPLDKLFSPGSRPYMQLKSGVGIPEIDQKVSPAPGIKFSSGLVRGNGLKSSNF